MPPLLKPNALSQQDLDNLRASGLNDLTILQNRLHTDNDALVFRYADYQTGELNGFARLRLHKPRIVAGKAVKYVQAKGTPARAYFPRGTLNDLRNSDCPIYLTEGEKKALALSQNGFPSIGIGGVWAWKVKDSDTLIADLAKVGWLGRTVYIVFDYDPKQETREHVAAAIVRLTKVLKSAGAGAVYAIDLPPAANNGKQGIDDYLVANGADRFRDLVSKATDCDAICGATMADAEKLVSSIRYLVHDWIPFGMLTGAVAEPGKGKSALVLGGLVRPLVLGLPWFNGTKGPAEPGRVLWCGTEGDIAITIDRMKRWKIPMDRVMLPFADDPLATICLMRDDHLLRIEALIDRYQIPLVVIDSLRGSHGEDENNSRMGQPLQALAGIAVRTGAAIVVIHHTKKMFLDEELSANSSRGSNAILAMFRSMIGVERPDSDSKWCRVRVLKENLGIAPEPFGFLVTDSGLQFGEAPSKPVRQTKENLAEQFLRDNMKPGEWYTAKKMTDQAEEELGVSKYAVHRATEAVGIVKEKRKEGWFWKLR